MLFDYFNEQFSYIAYLVVVSYVVSSCLHICWHHSWVRVEVTARWQSKNIWSRYVGLSVVPVQPVRSQMYQVGGHREYQGEVASACILRPAVFHPGAKILLK